MILAAIAAFAGAVEGFFCKRMEALLRATPERLEPGIFGSRVAGSRMIDKSTPASRYEPVPTWMGSVASV
ncbi:MAG: hypothetical protein ACREOI_13350 [bacterium]